MSICLLSVVCSTLHDPFFSRTRSTHIQYIMERHTCTKVLTSFISYFCREYLEGYFLHDPAHTRFIDWDVLKGYYDVGGVRIEDCILVTREGYENLTTAPKGDELLDVIRRGTSGTGEGALF